MDKMRRTQTQRRSASVMLEYEIDKSKWINKSSENQRKTQAIEHFSSILFVYLMIGEIYLEGLTSNLTSKQIKWIKLD